MFVDEKAMGEPYKPDKPAGLPKRLWMAILLPIPIAIFSFSFAAVYAVLGSWDSSAIMSGIGELSIAFSLASIIVSAVRLRAHDAPTTSPPS